jgi:ribonuclease HII
MPETDRSCHSKPFDHFHICGIDEAGRGPLAGPLVACGVYLDPQDMSALTKLDVRFTDGKKMTAKQRETVLTVVRELKLAHTVKTVSVATINTHGIQYANRIAIRRILSSGNADAYFIDGTIPLKHLKNRQIPVHTIPKADGFLIPVVLAGILAKVYRDRIMHRLHRSHPQYGWSGNAGYGTRAHLDAIRTHGQTEHHRKTFVASALSK